MTQIQTQFLEKYCKLRKFTKNVLQKSKKNLFDQEIRNKGFR